MKIIIFWLSLFSTSFSVFAYLRNFERKENAECMLAWLSVFFLSYTVFHTYSFYRKRGYTIKPKFQLMNTIVLLATVFGFQKFLFEKDLINEFLYNLPLYLILIVLCVLAFAKMIDEKKFSQK